jgi:membrane-associated HD superfamily phosphohydrolase
MWASTKALSVFLFVFFCIALIPKKFRKQTIPLFLMIFIPLIVVIGISFYKPLFVNRYLIPVTIAQTLLISYTILAIPNTFMQKLLAGSLLSGVILFNCWYPAQHAKLDIRTTFQEINFLKKPKDIIVASDAIIFMETLYYAKDKSTVRLYNPYDNPFPWYVGDALYSPSYRLFSLPKYPIRAFFVSTNGTYTIQYAPTFNR